MKTEDIHLVFTDDAIEELAKVAAEVRLLVDFNRLNVCFLYNFRLQRGGFAVPSDVQ